MVNLSLIQGKNAGGSIAPAGAAGRAPLRAAGTDSWAVTIGGRADSAVPVSFLIDGTGAWLRLGSSEAAAALEGCVRIEDAILSGTVICVEIARCFIRVRLNPAAVAVTPLASLLAKLRTMRVATALIFLGVPVPAEICASGAAATIRIRHIVAECQNLVRELASGSLGRPVKARLPGGEDAAEAYVVSDQGQWFLENDPGLRAAIGFDDPAVDAIGYAVRNMGFIKVAVRLPATIRVTLHPRNAVQHTVKAVAGFLAAKGHGEFSLEHLSEEWRVETFSSGAAAAARLSELSGSPLDPRPRERWHLTMATVDQLNAEPDNPLKLMHQKWRVSFGAFSESVFAFAMQHGLLDRFILVGARRPDAELVFRYIGDGLSSLYSDEFRVNAIGTSAAAQPDPEYGAWVAAAYRAVAVAGTPRLDYIDAHIPASTRGPWIRYERLLLPWTLPAGEILVSMSSQIKLDRLLTRPSA